MRQVRAFCLAFAFLACSADAGMEGDGDETAADELSLREGEIKLYFTNPIPDLVRRQVAAFDPDDPKVAKLVERGAGEPRPDEALVKVIDTATGQRCSVLLADYDFDLQPIADALVRAKRRGCDVRMITDGDTIDRSDPTANKVGRRKTFKPEYEQPFRSLREAEIPVHHDFARGSIMHNKYVVVNGKYVWTGGWNMSTDDTLKFFNNAALVRSKEASKRYAENFELLFAKYDPSHEIARERIPPPNDPSFHTFPVGDRQMEVYFPRSQPAIKRITDLARRAQRSVHVMAFSFTSKALGEALVDRAKAGVDVRAIFENSGACSGQYATLERAPAPAKAHIKALRWIYGPLNFMHHKVMILDSKSVVFASFNFSESAEQENDENVVIVHDPKIAEAFEKEFDFVEAATARVKQPAPCDVDSSPARPPADR